MDRIVNNQNKGGVLAAAQKAFIWLPVCPFWLCMPPGFTFASFLFYEHVISDLHFCIPELHQQHSLRLPHLPFLSAVSTVTNPPLNHMQAIPRNVRFHLTAGLCEDLHPCPGRPPLWTPSVNAACVKIIAYHLVLCRVADACSISLIKQILS